MNIPIITLTSDFGTKDYFVSAAKGRIYSELPNAHVVDISHKITPFSINETAYVIKNAYKHFPKGTVHIIAVDAEWSIKNKHYVFILDEHYFVCANNGIISLITSVLQPAKVIEITLPRDRENSYFLENFISAACHIARGGSLSLIGKETKEIKQLTEITPVINKDNNQILGNVIYIDNFGNLITNIEKELFIRIGQGRKFELHARSYIFTKIFDRYNEITNLEIPADKRNDDGKRLALFNSDNYLEIAVYKSNLKTVGGASSLLGLNYRDTVTLRFIDK